jgi:hypothetical protein
VFPASTCSEDARNGPRGNEAQKFRVLCQPALGATPLLLVHALGELLGVLYTIHKRPYPHGGCRKVMLYATDHAIVNIVERRPKVEEGLAAESSLQVTTKIIHLGDVLLAHGDLKWLVTIMCGTSGPPKRRSRKQ